MMNNAALPLGQKLIARGLISDDQLRIALHEQAGRQLPIGRLLVSLGFLSEKVLRDALSEALGKTAVDLAHATVDPLAIAQVPRELAKRYRLLPLAYDAERRHLLLAVADDHDLSGIDRVRYQLPTGTGIETVLATDSELDQAIDRHYGFELSIDGILREIETGEIEFFSPSTADEDFRQPTVRLVDALLADAVKRDASDIHFEPEAGFLRIRYRIDGILRQIRALHRAVWPAMTVRLKVMSGMNIAEMRAPQDGHFSLTVGGRAIDFRAASQPTLHGENIVLRILDRQKGIVPIDRLGLQDEHLAQLRKMVARPEGMILVTGPTGSGKTTTLYSLLGHISHEGIHIMTLEDPVEYPLPLLRQTSVGEAVKLDFAGGVRSMMRQDPDVILIGEIRDAETAEMAFRAALTGHQVYSTLHANSALGALPRLLDIGIRPDILAGNLIGIVAQRLVRRLCPHCRQPYPAAADEAALFGPSPGTGLMLFRAIGCEHCAFQGYRGRLAILEILAIDPTLDELIAERASLSAIRQAAVERGFRPLSEDGLRRVRCGDTSLAELARVVPLPIAP